MVPVRRPSVKGQLEYEGPGNQPNVSSSVSVALLVLIKQCKTAGLGKISQTASLRLDSPTCGDDSKSCELLVQSVLPRVGQQNLHVSALYSLHSTGGS
jgi:hypothetical protein